MNCAEVEKHLSEYLDNETASDMRQHIAEHLEACESCRKKLAELQSLSFSLSSLAEDLPEDFHFSVTEQLSKQKTMPDKVIPLRKRAWFKMASVAACLVICLGAVGVIVNHGGSVYQEAQENSAAPQSAEYILDKTIGSDEAAVDEQAYGSQNMASEDAAANDISGESADEARDNAVNDIDSTADAADAAEELSASEAEWGYGTILLVVGIIALIFIIAIVLLHHKKKSKI